MGNTISDRDQPGVTDNVQAHGLSLMNTDVFI